MLKGASYEEKLVSRSADARQPFLLSLHYTAPHWPWETRDDEAEAERFKFDTQIVCADLDLGRLRYVNDGSESQGDSFDFSVQGGEQEIEQDDARVVALVRLDEGVAALAGG